MHPVVALELSVHHLIRLRRWSELQIVWYYQKQYLNGHGGEIASWTCLACKYAKGEKDNLCGWWGHNTHTRPPPPPRGFKMHLTSPWKEKPDDVWSQLKHGAKTNCNPLSETAGLYLMNMSRDGEALSMFHFKHLLSSGFTSIEAKYWNKVNKSSSR